MSEIMRNKIMKKVKVIVITGLMISILFTVCIPSVSATIDTFGYNTKAKTANLNSNYIAGTLFVCLQNGVAQSITVWLDCWQSTLKAKCAIYSSDRTTLIGTTEEKVLGYKQTWQTFNFITQPNLVAGTQYYLVSWANSGTDHVYNYYSSVSGYTSISASNTYGSTWPSSLSGTTKSNRVYSIYCTYNTGSGTVIVPTVMTSAATGTSCNSTTLNGNLGNMGGASSCQVWFQYGLSTSYGSTTTQQSKTSTGSFSSVVSLSESTTYHYRAAASNSAGTVYGSDMTVTTPACGGGPTEGYATINSVIANPNSVISGGSSVITATIKNTGVTDTLFVEFIVGGVTQQSLTSSVLNGGIWAPSYTLTNIATQTVVQVKAGHIGANNSYVYDSTQSVTITIQSTGGTGTFGYSTKGKTAITGKNYIISGKYICPVDAIAQSITVYIECWYSDSKVKCAIYSGDRITKIGETQERTVGNKQGWQTFNFISQPSLTANTAYYLSVWTNRGYPFYDSLAGNEECGFAYTYGSTWPSSISGTIYSRALSIYCTYSSSSGSPSLAYSPSSYSFGTMQAGQTASTSFSIWNSGIGTLNYSFAESTSWLSVSPMSGSSTGEHDTITVSIDTAGLSTGSYSGPVTISGGSGGTFTASVNIGTAGASFSIIAIPDTQEYTYAPGWNYVFNLETQWCADHKTSLNIAAVCGEGDITSYSTDAEYTCASNAYAILDNANIPYVTPTGNHDDSISQYNKYFPLSRYTGKSWFGGYYNGLNSATDSYILFNAGGMDFIILCLEYNPTTAELNWANSIFQQYSNRRAIFVTHCLLNTDGSWAEDGQSVYNALKGNSNLFLMLCGHMHTVNVGTTVPENEAMRTETYSGHTIYIVLANYQCVAPNEQGNGPWGGGIIRIMTFTPSANQIHFQTYQLLPTIHYYTDTKSDFVLTYNMN